MSQKNASEQSENISKNETPINAEETAQEAVASDSVEESIEKPKSDELDILAQEVGEWKEKYAYLRADFDNYRRRVAKDLQVARQDGLISAIDPILHVFDHFKMAMNAAEKFDNIQKLKEGLGMISNEFNKSIQDLGIVAIDSEGTSFDPSIHEAVSHIPSEKPEGVVVQQWSCGYKMGDRLLRPARVVVSSGPEKTEE